MSSERAAIRALDERFTSLLVAQIEQRQFHGCFAEANVLTEALNACAIRRNSTTGIILRQWHSEKNLAISKCRDALAAVSWREWQNLRFDREHRHIWALASTIRTSAEHGGVPGPVSWPKAIAFACASERGRLPGLLAALHLGNSAGYSNLVSIFESALLGDRRLWAAVGLFRLRRTIQNSESLVQIIERLLTSMGVPDDYVHPTLRVIPATSAETVRMFQMLRQSSPATFTAMTLVSLILSFKCGVSSRAIARLFDVWRKSDIFLLSRFAWEAGAVLPSGRFARDELARAMAAISVPEADRFSMHPMGDVGPLAKVACRRAALISCTAAIIGDADPLLRTAKDCVSMSGTVERALFSVICRSGMTLGIADNCALTSGPLDLAPLFALPSQAPNSASQITLSIGRSLKKYLDECDPLTEFLSSDTSFHRGATPPSAQVTYRGHAFIFRFPIESKLGRSSTMDQLHLELIRALDPSAGTSAAMFLEPERVVAIITSDTPVEILTWLVYGLARIPISLRRAIAIGGCPGYVKIERRNDALVPVGSAVERANSASLVARADQILLVAPSDPSFSFSEQAKYEAELLNPSEGERRSSRLGRATLRDGKKLDVYSLGSRLHGVGEQILEWAIK